MAMIISMIICNEKPDLFEIDILEDLGSRWGLTSTGVKREGGVLSFRNEPVDVVIGVIPKPIPGRDLKGPCSTSVLWPNSANDVKAHQSHIIVTVNGKLDMILLSKHLSKIVTSTMVATPETRGLLWNNAVHLVEKSLFIECATEIMPARLPLELWVDFRVGLNPDGTSAGFTAGLSALGRMEIEVESSPEKPEALRDRLHKLAEYLLEKGPVINNGDTIGADADEIIRAVHSPSRFGHKGQVIRLVYKKASPEHPWQ